jgi:hypothetical protein
VANELNIGAASGSSVYTTLRRATDSYVYQTTTTTFVVWVDANIANYDIALTDRSGDYFSADMPAAITASGTYIANYYVMAGATPATSDTLLDSEEIYWDGGTASAAPVGGNTITIGAAVTILRVACRNEGATDDDDAVYSLTEKHLAIQRLFSDFARETRCIQAVNSFTVTASSSTITLAAVAGFHSERAQKAWIDAENFPLSIIGIDEITAMLADDTAEGDPTHIAFDATTGTGKIYPTPSDSYTGKVQWFAPLTAFDAGDTGVANTELNIPADLATEVLWRGAIWALQGNQVEHAALAERSRADYELYRATKMGAGNFGQREITREITRCW